MEYRITLVIEFDVKGKSEKQIADRAKLMTAYIASIYTPDAKWMPKEIETGNIFMQEL